MKRVDKIGRRDGFISHATEDKDVIARPLADALRQKGYTVWYDESEIRLGDSLHGAIERGLATCRFGVVILSPAFLQKQWTIKELEGLFAREIKEGRKIILPVWHSIDFEEIVRTFPILAGKKAVSTATGLDTVVREISAVFGPPAAMNALNRLPTDASSVAPSVNWRRPAGGALVLCVLAVGTFFARPQAPIKRQGGRNDLLPVGANLAIHVLAEDSARVISGASIWVHKHGEGVCGPTASDSNGTIYCAIEPGAYDLAIRYEGLTFTRKLVVGNGPLEATFHVAREPR